MKLEYTLQAEDVLSITEETAVKMKHGYIGTEHLLYALASYPAGSACKILEENGVKADKIREYLAKSIEITRKKLKGEESYSPSLKDVLLKAQKEAKKLKCNNIGTEHLLFAVLNTSDCVGMKLLNTMKINTAKIYVDILVTCGMDVNAAKKEYGQLTIHKSSLFVSFTNHSLLQASCGRLFHKGE